MTGQQPDIQWYIARDGKQHGPLSDVEMRTFVGAGAPAADRPDLAPRLCRLAPGAGGVPLPGARARRAPAAFNPCAARRAADRFGERAAASPPRSAPSSPSRIRVAHGTRDRGRRGRAASSALPWSLLLLIAAGGGWYAVAEGFSRNRSQPAGTMPPRAASSPTRRRRTGVVTDAAAGAARQSTAPGAARAGSAAGGREERRKSSTPSSSRRRCGTWSSASSPTGTASSCTRRQSFRPRTSRELDIAKHLAAGARRAAAQARQ